VVDQTTPDEHAVVPFLRAGPPPDRTRWEGWQQRRKIRGTFVPAPRLTPAEHQSLSPRRRALHDLHRTATHVNMPLQETPMSARVANLMRGRLRNNAVKFMPGTRDGLMINGGGFQGKTETACDAAASFEDVWRDVPACLPQALAERHLSFLSDITPKMRRRTASVFLVRRARGGGLNEAAQFLGISTPDRMIGCTRLLNRHLRTRGTARDFEQALDAITAELLAGPVIDYQRRRAVLASWTLEPENWQHMLTQLPVLTNRRKPISDDRRRLVVSACIWTRVTEGEPDFAPCPPHIAPDPELRAVWTQERHNVFHWLRKADHQPYYGALKPLLEDHAEHLAKAIDRR
jgi:hypothetical protein